FIEEPFGPGLDVHPVGTQADSLYNLADGARLDQLTRFDGGLVFKPFAIHNGVDAAGFLLNAAYLCELIECNDARFIHHIIFAMLHYAYTQRRAIDGDGSTDDELYGSVFQDLLFAAGKFGVGETLGETFSEIRLFRIERYKLC